MIPTTSNYLKIIDFEGCSIEDGHSSSGYERFSYKPSTPEISIQTDILAFGCAIYEVVTGRPPYQELEASDDPRDRVKRLYQNNQFPDIAYLPMRNVILDWSHGEFNSMDDTLDSIESSEHSDVHAGLPFEDI